MNSHTGHTKPCNCRKKDKCPLNGQCLAQDIVYKCIASTSMNPDKTYLGTAEGDFKKRYNNHTKSFRHKRYSKETTLSKYIWEIKKEYNEMPTLKWSIVKFVPNISTGFPNSMHFLIWIMFFLTCNWLWFHWFSYEIEFLTLFSYDLMCFYLSMKLPTPI